MVELSSFCPALADSLGGTAQTIWWCATMRCTRAMIQRPRPDNDQPNFQLSWVAAAIGKPSNLELQFVLFPSTFICPSELGQPQVLYLQEGTGPANL